MHESLMTRLTSLSDERYRRFNEGLIPGSEEKILGVPMGELRKIARELIEEDWRRFLEAPDEGIHELILIKCLVTAMAPCGIEEKLFHLSRIVPRLENWAQCDTLASAFKAAKKYPEAVYAFLLPYKEREEVYSKRFFVVMLLNYYLTDAYIDEVLFSLREIRHGDYYVKMAVAWALSFCFIRYRDKTLALFREKELSPWIQNKAIQKCRESCRVSREDKALLLECKI